MNKLLKVIVPTALLGAIAIGFQNCSKTGFGQDATQYNSLNAAYGGPAICDPLSGGAGGGPAGASQGLIGKLIYETAADQAKFGTPATYPALVKVGTVAPATLFMSQMNVPTRSFTEGFSANGAAALTDQSTGQKLVEWFGIDMNSTIKLGAGDRPGYYQFATVSDDGSILLLDGATLIDNDGTHSTRARCAPQAVYLDAKSARPIEYKYFQGPRTEIASQILWRKVAGPNPDGTCNTSSAADGWAVVPAQNFFLPSDAPANPCP